MRWSRVRTQSAPLIGALAGALLIVLPDAASHARQPDDPREDAKRVNTELATTGALLETASEQARTAAAALEAVNQQLPAAEHGWCWRAAR